MWQSCSGSGLGEFADQLQDGITVPYGDLPHWPASRVVGHEGRLVVGGVKGRLIAALSGRCHAYEGHDLQSRHVCRPRDGLARRQDARSDQRCRWREHRLLTRDSDGDRRSHQPHRRQPAGRRKRRTVRSPVSRHDRCLFAAPPRDRRRGWRGARRDAVARRLCWRCSDPATRRRPRFATLRAIGADAVGMSTVPGSDRRAPHGDGGARDLVHHQHGRRVSCRSRSITPK